MPSAAPVPPTDPPPAGQQHYPTGGAFHFDQDGRGQGRGYTWQVDYQGAFALAIVQLQPEQAIVA